MTVIVQSDETERWSKFSDKDWKERLTSEQYKVLRKRGTERPYAGKLYRHKQEGTYHCAGCDTPLFLSQHKFDSGSGWPAFFDSVPGAVREKPDGRRTEVVCAVCKGHLGHVFRNEGFGTPTDLRHCVNSVSLTFKDPSGNAPDIPDSEEKERNILMMFSNLFRPGV